MKIERKKGLKGVKVTHNRGIFWTAVVLFVILIAVVVAIKSIGNKENEIGVNETIECLNDDDCVPASCCHSSSCIPKSDSPKCSEVFCSMECRENTLDCGHGSCSCVNSKCEVKWNK